MHVCVGTSLIISLSLLSSCTLILFCCKHHFGCLVCFPQLALFVSTKKSHWSNDSWLIGLIDLMILIPYLHHFCKLWMSTLSSVWKSGPVRSFDPQGHGPGPGPVYHCHKRSKNRTGLIKTGLLRSFAVLDRSFRLFGKGQYCSLLFYADFKPLIIKFGCELNILCYILWNLKIWRATFVVSTVFLFLSQFSTNLDENYIEI